MSYTKAEKQIGRMKITKQNEWLTQKEGQCFDRKSIMVEPKALAVPLLALANADGGTILVGVRNDGEVEGVAGHEQRVNELLRVPFDFCRPTVKVDFDFIPCKDRHGQPNKLLLIRVHQSQNVHANQADEVFYRVGDKSKKLSFDERMQLLYDKGDRFYEDTPVPGATVSDLNLDIVRSHTKKIGYKKAPLNYLRENNGFISKERGKERLSVAAVLLFGKAPQRFFPMARVRFIRYEGTVEKTGASMNVIKDVMFEGTILDIVQKAIAFVSTQTKEHSYLGKDGLFVTVPQYPEFVRQESIVNAVAHRDYSIKGTDIQIKMFDDRLVVESPGTLPGLVRLNTMRNVHFSRNPKIAAFLREYGYVKEFGEGVDRMCAEMAELGLPDPEYRLDSFILRCTIRSISEAATEVKPSTGDKTTAQVTTTGTGEVGEQVAGQVAPPYGTKSMPHRDQLSANGQKPGGESGGEPGGESGGESGGELNMRQRILELLDGGHLSKSEIAKRMGKNKPTRYLDDLMRALIDNGIVEYTIPDKPNSRLQKYRLTEKGRNIIKGRIS